MAVEKVIYFRDYEHRSDPDAGQPRDPAEADAVVIVLPVIRIERNGSELEIGRKSR